ncbi:MAG: helix-turn-helix transcriptional regulator [Anaerolinea sp.]|nr:helix-turn-helix transcriptional regulator [Anaerolinea sp.]
MRDENQEPVAALFKALMHPTRIAILDLLREGAQCVCHLEAALDVRQAYVSQQLSVLREAGLVEDERDGLNVYYRVLKPEVYALLDRARAITGTQPMSPLASDQKEACPCPKCASTTLEKQSLERNR